jgi:hypothetical protein
VRGGLEWAAHGEQEVTGVEEGGGGGVLDSGRSEGKRASGMRREEVSATLESEKKGRGGVHRQLLRQQGGGRQSHGAAWHARERAREEELGR